MIHMTNPPQDDAFSGGSSAPASEPFAASSTDPFGSSAQAGAGAGGADLLGAWDETPASPAPTSGTASFDPMSKVFDDFGQTTLNDASPGLGDAFGGAASPPAVISSASPPKPDTAPPGSVWDPVDERWVASEDAAAISGRDEAQSPTSRRKSAIVGISLDGPVDTTGKSEDVVEAMEARKAAMEDAQAAAKAELKAREQKKNEEEGLEVELRARLDPALTEWSEDYGKKKNIRGLLAGLDTILWEGSGWKPIGLGDLLTPKQVKLAYRKATLRVHPDRVVSLELEKRFIAKRVFDAIQQAYTEFEQTEGG